MEQSALNKRNYEEKLIQPRRGGNMAIITVAVSVIALAIIIIGGIMLGSTTDENGDFLPNANMAVAAFGIIFLVVGILYYCIGLPILCSGFKVINPNEALVLMFFGKYVGTIVQEGFYWVNPFCTGYNPAATSILLQSLAENKKGEKTTAQSFKGKKLSLKAMTLNNEKQKVNDEDGNPIEIGVVVIWKIINTAKAVFNVENYAEFISTQADSAIRQVARQYPYDVSEGGDEKSLRGSTQEISDALRRELQVKVEVAGIEILEAKISHLAYAPEIAAAMLQRQQAGAIIVARQKIVEGAVGMVEMALTKLSENNVCTLDEERKAQMVSNLLVVLCGSKDAQPIVNSGSIY